MSVVWTMTVETPEEIAERIVWYDLTYKTNPNGVNEPDMVDDKALIATIAQAIRDAYELAAKVCDAHAADRQQKMDDCRNQRTYDYFEDMKAAYQYAAEDIRKLKGETT